jgi:hypothetical protein
MNNNNNKIIYKNKIIKINNPIKYDIGLLIKKIPLISIKNFSLNIGIEIETCTTRKSENNINKNNKLKYFIDTKNGTIKCNSGFNGKEYIINGYIENKNLYSLYHNINSINKNSKQCKDDSCGLHFHISSNNIKLSVQGLFFLINFILKWNDTYQKEFEERFFYKKYVGKSYSKPLKLSEKDIELLKTQKQKLIENIKKNKNIIFLLSILKIIINITRNNPNNIHENNLIYENNQSIGKRTYLAIVNDNDFIHVEFRDLLPWALKRTIINFPALVKEKYLEIIEETNKEIEEINNNM